jgi:hypothetical protein
MQINRFYLISIFCIAFLLACDNSKDKELIIGHWTGVEWLEEGAPSLYTPADASFQFESTGDYAFTYAGNTEQGKYFVSNHQLFTTPDGGIKMMVKVVKLDQDTLRFDMNRGGKSERLTLVRQ